MIFAERAKSKQSSSFSLIKITAAIFLKLLKKISYGAVITEKAIKCAVTAIKIY